MVNNYEFEKQFRNIGIDKDQILGIGKEKEKAQAQQPKQQAHQEPSQLENEIALLKRKLDYITNSIIPNIESKFKPLEDKLAQASSGNQEYRKELIVLRNEVDELKKKLSNARVVFDDGTFSAPAVQSSVAQQSQQPTPSVSQSSQAASTSRSSSGQQQGEIRIDKIFNFSNKKF
ncbi:MAG: hypothetical protein QW594_01120 [Candidatus Woesearchaeota archaeon]